MKYFSRNEIQERLAFIFINECDAKQLSITVGLCHWYFFCVAQHVLQVFIAQASNVFMTWVPGGSAVCLEEQVDICKRVLNIYRFMVMNTPMEQKTWFVPLRLSLASFVWLICFIWYPTGSNCFSSYCKWRVKFLVIKSQIKRNTRWRIALLRPFFKL